MAKSVYGVTIAAHKRRCAVADPGFPSQKQPIPKWGCQPRSNLLGYFPPQNCTKMKAIWPKRECASRIPVPSATDVPTDGKKLSGSVLWFTIPALDFGWCMPTVLILLSRVCLSVILFTRGKSNVTIPHGAIGHLIGHGHPPRDLMHINERDIS